MNRSFEIVRPVAGGIPLLVSVPHAASRFPEDLVPCGAPATCRDIDLFTDQLWRGVPAHGGTLLTANFSRYVVDLNRARDDLTPEVVRGGVAVHQPGYYQNRGVVWRSTTDGIELLQAPLSPEQLEWRLSRYYDPYHQALSSEVERLHAQFGTCILVDAHSMPSAGAPGRAPRAEVVPGDLQGRSCAAELSFAVSEHFRGLGYSVKPNAPYKGGWITRTYGRPADGVHAIQIEVGRGLYMDEQTYEPDVVGMARLEAACTDLVKRISGLRLPQF